MNERITLGGGVCVLLFACIDCAGPAFSADLARETPAGSGGTSSQLGPALTAGAAAQTGGSVQVTPAQASGAAGELDDGANQTGGAGGAGGDGGDSASAGASAGPTCPAPIIGALQVSVCQERDDPFAPGEHASNEPHPFLLLTNDGPNIQLSRIKVRYFFSAEISGTWQAGYFWATKLNGAPFDSAKGFAPGPRLAIQSWSPAQPDADHSLELSFDPASTVVLPSGTSLEVRAWFRTSTEGELIQRDDWSFVPSSPEVQTIEGFDYRENAHAALYVDDQLVWGTEPCRVMTAPFSL
jgi:hypothetical protein